MKTPFKVKYLGEWRGAGVVSPLRVYTTRHPATKISLAMLSLDFNFQLSGRKALNRRESKDQLCPFSSNSPCSIFTDRKNWEKPTLRTRCRKFPNLVKTVKSINAKRIRCRSGVRHILRIFLGKISKSKTSSGKL
jgi:hypothetical protein